jgi:hypothetical protein
MPDPYEDVCDTRLWMMDLEGDCRRVIEAMPPERRARFSLVKIVSWETRYGQGDPDDPEWDAFVKEQAEKAVVHFFVTVRIAGKTWYFTMPFTEAMLKDVGYTEQCADLLLRRAEFWVAERERDGEAA